MAGPQRQLTPAQLDQYITGLILQNGEDLTQSIASGSFVPNGNNNAVNVQMRNVGLTRGWLLKVTADLVNAGSGAASLTPWGAANLVINVLVTDLDNYQRVNTPGWHLTALNTAKEGFPFGAAVLATAMDAPVKFGNNFDCIFADATIAGSGGTGQIQMYYWIPAAYGKYDLRGAIYTGVVNSTGYVQFTINPTPGVASGDAVLSCYSGANTNVSITNVQWQMYQNYIDQLPRWADGPQKGGIMLPPQSIRTQYRLNNTALGAVLAGQDFPIPYTNFQTFLSTTIIYDQAGTLNPGDDVNYFALQAANTLQFFKLDPITQALRSRVKIKTDYPVGSYMFDLRDAPVNTNQSGNIQLVMNPITAATNSKVLVGWEAFADIQAVLGAQSLPAS